MKTILRNYRQSPRKVALAAALVRGKTAGVAITQLRFATKARLLLLLLNSFRVLFLMHEVGITNPRRSYNSKFRVDQVLL